MRSALLSAWNLHIYALLVFMLDRFRSELHQAVRLSPDNAAWHYRLGNAYAREKEPAQADLELKTLKALRAKSTNQGTEWMRLRKSSSRCNSFKFREASAIP